MEHAEFVGMLQAATTCSSSGRPSARVRGPMRLIRSCSASPGSQGMTRYTRPAGVAPSWRMGQTLGWSSGWR